MHGDGGGAHLSQKGWPFLETVLFTLVISGLDVSSDYVIVLFSYIYRDLTSTEGWFDVQYLWW